MSERKRNKPGAAERDLLKTLGNRQQEVRKVDKENKNVGADSALDSNETGASRLNIARDGYALAQASVICLPGTSEQDKQLFLESTIALYLQFDATDAIETLLARIMVGMGNMTMDCLARSVVADTVVGRELELSYATRGALVVTELTKAFDGHRGRGKQNVTVGHVNVGSGGQAVVGNVNAERARDQVPDPEPTSPAAAPRKKKNIKRFRLHKRSGGQT